MLHFFIGSIIMLVGFAMIAKSEWLLNNFGHIEFFERHLGTEGGSRLGYKLFGILALFIGFLFVTGMITGFITWMVSPLTKYSLPK
ncbi:hypothetical protein A3J77_00575 [Candidatus Wolfebacteria bacterium RBG_13_41_7]|uniref:DUF3784 domain-containing protein n=1 Tax=Candidatus Wolfebacteria bacterium RBG_13_41_7 TaxID=1802554 RepID=A0A1F8DPE6_9BACT|nr:MAG: hypothetical protein A3J77_00575 [Candidatus Wolfebacteria bacterium RBG_13_41_7]